MNAFVSIASVWFTTLANLSLQAAFLCAIVYLVTKLIGRRIPPNWRALLWFLVIVRALIPIAPQTPFSLQNLFVNQAQMAREIAPTFRVEIDPVPSPITTRTAAAGDFTLAQAQTAPARQPTPSRIPGVLRIVWAVGAIFSFSSLAVRSLAIRRRLIRSKSPVPPEVIETLNTCLKDVRCLCPVSVAISDEIAAPALTGLLPARLIIPANFASDNFSLAQIRQIILHELAHIRLGHLLFHWLALIARCLHWFNPFIHFAAARLRHECEVAADAAVLETATDEERVAYGETILQALAQTTAPSTALALGLAEQARHLEDRLRAVRSTSHGSRLVGIATLFALGLTGLSDPQQSAPENAKPSKSEVRETATLPSAATLPAINRATADRSREALWKKLETTEIADYPLPEEADLVDLLKELAIEVRKRDPDGKGINLIISQNSDKTEPFVDAEKFRIKFDPPIRNVTLRQFLDAIVMVAKPPTNAANYGLKYSVVDYGVVFSARKIDDPGALYTRTFKLNPNTFQQGLEGVTFSPNPFPGAATNRSTLQNVRDFFMAAGADFPTNALTSTPEQSRKALFFNDRTGVLFVRASLTDLDIVENALHTLNRQPPQVLFNVHIAEVTDQVATEIATKFPSLAGEKIGTTTSEYVVAGASGTNTVAGLRLPASQHRLENLKGPINSAATLSETRRVVLSDAQARELEEYFKNREGVDLLGMPAVTTLLGRQARVSVEESKTFVTPDTLLSGGGVQIPLGPSVDLLADRVTDSGVHLQTTVTETDFLGYQTADDEQLKAGAQPQPHPAFRVRGSQAVEEIPFNSSLLLVVDLWERRPVSPLADIPLLGRLFRASPADRKMRKAYILVTADIVDGAGNHIDLQKPKK
jgi:beta-lactamase regulating signal transducer with metallopeptidase domain